MAASRCCSIACHSSATPPPSDAVAIGLVHHEDVGDLQDAGLRHLDGVAQAGRQDHYRRVGGRRDLHLGLAYPDRFDQDQVVTGRVQDANGLGGGKRHAAEVASRGHGTDEYIRVGGVLLHPHPVTEKRPARVGRGRVHREDRDTEPSFTRLADERARKGGLADPGGPGDADRSRPARSREDARRQLLQLGTAVLDQRDGARHGALVSCQDPCYQLFDLHGWQSLTGRGPAGYGRQGVPQRAAVVTLGHQSRVLGRGHLRGDHRQVDLLAVHAR